MGKRQSVFEGRQIVFGIFVLAIFLSLVFYLVPLHSINQPSESVTIYYADYISQAHRQIIDKFNQVHRGRIEVVPINLPFTKFNTNERKELIARALRSRNNRIDVFAVDQIWVSRFARWAEPLSKYFLQKDLKLMLPHALKTCYVGNRLVGIPLYLDIGVLYYRIDLLKKIPEWRVLERKLKESITWEEFLEIQKKYYFNQPIYLIQADNYEGLICNYVEILGGIGGKLMSSDTFSFAGAREIQACELMKDLIWKYNLIPSVVTTFNEIESYHYALKNDIPFFRGWPSFVKSTDVPEEELPKVKLLRIAALPHSKGYTSAPVFGGWNLMISKYSEKKKEAMEFIRFAVSEAAQRILRKEGAYLPVINSIYDDPNLPNLDSSLYYIRSLLDYGIHRPSHPAYTRISDILSYHLNLALRNEETPEVALRQVEREARQLHKSKSVQEIGSGF